MLVQIHLVSIAHFLQIRVADAVAIQTSAELRQEFGSSSKIGGLMRAALRQEFGSSSETGAGGGMRIAIDHAGQVSFPTDIHTSQQVHGCTENQRVDRNRTWWSQSSAPTGNDGIEECMTGLGDLNWLSVIDGWAQAMGRDAFNGTDISKNKGFNTSGETGAKGDFLHDQGLMLQQMIDLGDAELSAASVRSVVRPYYLLLSDSEQLFCLSNFDPRSDDHNPFPECSRSLAPDILKHQQPDLDSNLYDLHGKRLPEPPEEDFRLRLLQTYLDDYHSELSSLASNQHDQKLRVVARLAWRFAWLHPFCDGNGRMRTLLLQRELCRLGYHPVSLFDNNIELLYQTLPVFEEELIEAMFMWEDAYAFRCIPWTPGRVENHRQKFGARSWGLPEHCNAESFHKQFSKLAQQHGQ
jgi:hypothetical protein